MNLRLTISCIAIVAVAAGFVQSALAGDGNDQGDDQGANGTSYIATITDSNGNFASRGVITLHSDHTMSVIDSGQGGPQFFFSSQLGAWHVGGNGVVTGRTIDFDFPSADIARLDYTIHFGANGSATGTITLTNFPLHANPLGGGGTVVGTFTFTAYSIAP
jgi:hypothetical protein